MSEDQFKKLLAESIGWTHELKIEECDKCELPDECGSDYCVNLTLWGKTIADYFVVQKGQWYCEAGEGITVNSRLTVWQWLAMRFADQAGAIIE